MSNHSNGISAAKRNFLIFTEGLFASKGFLCAVLLALMTFVMSPEPKSACAQDSNKGKKWAVVVGSDIYMSPRVSNLTCCVADAKLVARTLAEKCGYDENHILLLTTKNKKLDELKNDEVLWLSTLRGQIKRWLSHAAEEDTMLVFYSGHGFVDKETGQGYLATFDCDPDNLAGTALPTSELRQMMQACKAKQKLLVLDCCHAASATSRKGPDEETGAASEELSKIFQSAQGLITFASCKENEKSYEGYRQQGLFTQVFVEGLSGAADYREHGGNEDGFVDSNELYNYTFGHVPPLATKLFNQSQTPVRLIGQDVTGTFALARRILWTPRGFTAAPGAKPHQPRTRNKPCYTRIYREIGGVRAEFVLVDSKSAGAADAFYIMKDKVSNELFAKFAMAKNLKNAQEFVQAVKAGNGRLPAVNMTVEQAHQFARWLAGDLGNLPTRQQWDTAAGFYERNSDYPEGPYRGAWKDDGQLQAAVGRDAPLPIGQAEEDETWCGCRDMSGNGWEWTRDGFGFEVPLKNPHPRLDLVYCRGKTWTADEPLRFEDLGPRNPGKPEFYAGRSKELGFRVVLEVPRELKVAYR